jgi:hypothetical protein
MGVNQPKEDTGKDSLSSKYHPHLHSAQGTFSRAGKPCHLEKAAEGFDWGESQLRSLPESDKTKKRVNVGGE